jgi:hypothetical protein
LVCAATVAATKQTSAMARKIRDIQFHLLENFWGAFGESVAA